MKVLKQLLPIVLLISALAFLVYDKVSDGRFFWEKKHTCEFCNTRNYGIICPVCGSKDATTWKCFNCKKTNAKDICTCGMTREEQANHILECTYTRSGAMEGGYYSVTLKNEGGKVKLVISEQVNFSSKTKTTTYKITYEQYLEFEKLVKTTYYDEWDSYPNNQIEVLDGPTSSISLRIKNDYYSLSSDKEVPEDRTYPIALLRNAMLSMVGRENDI